MPIPYSGAVFVFRSKRGDYVKVLHWDGSGAVPLRQAFRKGPFGVAADCE